MPNGASRIQRKPHYSVSWLTVAAFVAAFSLVLAAGFGLATGSIRVDDLRLRFSEPYRLASQLAAEDPTIAQSIGSVQSVAWLPKGQLETSGSDGSCQLELAVTGERADAVLETGLAKRGGVWFWEWANLRLDDGELLTLPVP